MLLSNSIFGKFILWGKLGKGDGFMEDQMLAMTLCPVGTKRLETERLVLRKFESGDSEAFFLNWGSDPLVTQFLSWKTHETVQDSAAVIQNWLNQYESTNYYNWAIVLKENHKPIGNITVVKLDEKSFSCEIGYCIGSVYWNRGFVTEAFTKIIAFLFEEVGLNRVSARHNVLNPASGKVMEKCHLVYEGTLREASFKKGTFQSLAVYSILKSEWVATQMGGQS